MSDGKGDIRHFWLGGRRRPEQDRFFVEALDSLLWAPGDPEHWDTCWYTGMPEAAAFGRAGPGRMINHIPGNNGLTVKSYLYKTIVKTRDRLIAQAGPAHPHVARMDFVPRTYAMPEDYFSLQQAAFDAPDKRWILKPRNAARGKDIRILNDVSTVPVGNRWMVQEYIDNPHTMHGHKYVLRLYVLISGVEPLRVYLYEQGFAKLASAPYTLDDLDNPYAHLTNPDINVLNVDAPAPVVFVDFDRYRPWLREQGHDDDALFARIRDLVALTAISAREHMRRRMREARVDPRGCYELIGLDCLVDTELKPWLLECNLSPSMEVCAAPEDGGVAEARIKRQMIADMVALLGLNAPRSESMAPDSVEDMVVAAEAEHARAGGFQRVFPDSAAADQLAFMPLPRLADMLLADAIKGAAVPRPRVRRWQAAEILTPDRVMLYDSARGLCYGTNPTGALTWLQATHGLDPDAVAEELYAATADTGQPAAASTIRQDVWDSLADWAQDGLLIQDGYDAPHESAGAEAIKSREATGAGKSSLDIKVGASTMRIHSAEAPVMKRLHELFAPMAAVMESPRALRKDIHIVRAASGYAVIIDGRLEPGTLRLAELVPWLSSSLLRLAAGRGEIALDGCMVALEEEGVAAWVCSAGECDDGLALALAAHHGRGFGGGLRFIPGAAPAATVIGLPVRSRLSEPCPIQVRNQAMESHVYQAAGLGEIRLLPAVQAGPPCEIAAVILPDPAAPSERPVTNVGLDEFMARLLPGCCGSAGAPPEIYAVSRLAAWLAQRERIMTHPSAVAALMDKLSDMKCGRSVMKYED